MNKISNISKKFKNKITFTDNTEITTLRPFQENFCKDFNRKTKKHTIVISPCGSGKTTLCKAFACYDVVKKPGQKQLFLVPQNHIGAGFLKTFKLSLDDKIYHCEILNDFVNNNSKNKIDDLKKFLLSPLNEKHKEKVVKYYDFTNNCAVATHAAFLACFKNLSEKEKEIAVNNLTIYVDEAHHIENASSHHNFSDDINDLTNQFGNFITFLLKNDFENTQINLLTATFFRGDYNQIINSESLSSFEMMRYSFIDFIQTISIEDINFNCFGYNPKEDSFFNDFSDDILSIFNPNKKTWIKIPSVGNKWRKNYDDYLFIINKIKQKFPDLQLIDLVNKKTQESNKEILLKNSSGVDVIVTCMLGVEGTDWIECDTIIDLAPFNSPTFAIQFFSRALRHYENKKSVEVNYFVKTNKEISESTNKRELFSDYLNTQMCILIFEEYISPILVNLKNLDDKNEKTLPLTEVLGDDYQSIIKLLIENVEEALILNQNEDVKDIIDQQIENIFNEFEITSNKESITDGLKQVLVKTILISEKTKNNLAEKLEIHDTEPAFSIDISYLREELGLDYVLHKVLGNGTSLLHANLTIDDLKNYKTILGLDIIETKNTLIKMAQNNEKRPSKESKNDEEKRLGQRLCSYSNPGSGSYDFDFHAKIKEINPEWFVKSSDVNKKKILFMARNGYPRPKSKQENDIEQSNLAVYLRSYITPGSSFDKSFLDELQKLRPDWFEKNDTVSENKKELLKLAKQSKKRPNKESENIEEKKLGEALCRYTNSKRKMYDADFSKKVFELNPDWFADKSYEKKQLLLSMAGRGEQRPNVNSENPEVRKLAHNHNSYVGKGCYDSDYVEKLRKINPAWIYDVEAKKISKIEQLIEWGKINSKKPSRHSECKIERSFAIFLKKIKSKKEFDEDAVQNLKNIFPSWFK